MRGLGTRRGAETYDGEDGGEEEKVVGEDGGEVEAVAAASGRHCGGDCGGRMCTDGGRG